MKVEFSKAFIKASKHLSGKMLDSLRRTIAEVKADKDIQDITDSKKLVGYRNIYRIRLGDYRALFTLEIEFSGKSRVINKFISWFFRSRLTTYTSHLSLSFLLHCSILRYWKESATIPIKHCSLASPYNSPQSTS